MTSLEEPRFSKRGYTFESDNSKTSQMSFSVNDSEEFNSGEIQSKSGSLRKKSWASWREVFVTVEMGVLFEFKSQKHQKPNKIYTLSHYGVRLADDLTGTNFSFGLFSHRKDPIFFSTDTESDLVSWVAVCGKFCSNMEVEWRQDEMLEAFNDAVIMSSDVGCVIGVNESALALFGYTRSELMGRSVKILMPEPIARNHDKYMANYFHTHEKRLIGKPRKFQAISKEKELISIELSLGEINTPTERRFLARFRSVGKEGPSSSGQMVKQIVEESVDELFPKYQEQVKEQVTQNLLEHVKLENEKKDDEIRHLNAKIQKLQHQVSKHKKDGGEEKSEKYLPSQYERVISLRHAQLNERISGEGGSGCGIYVCTVDGWQCAAKVLNMEGIPQHQIAKFEAEVSLLESLKPHRNLVQYLFHERSRTTMKLFMRRYAMTLGGYLREQHEMEHRLSRKEIASIGLDIIVGLEVLHTNQIIHRDLKLENIFITLDGMRNLQSCAIGDMDAARKLFDGVKASTIIGTPGYMAPEIFSASGEYRFPVDIWSFGIVLYECFLNGGTEAEEWPPSRAQEKITKSGQFPFDVDPEFAPIEKLIAKCLRKNPKKRPTAAALKGEILHLTVQ